MICIKRWTPHASDCDRELAFTAPRCQITIRLGPSCLRTLAALPANWTTAALRRPQHFGMPTPPIIGVPLQRFRRKLSAYGTHLCRCICWPSMLCPKGQVMRWQASQRHANHVHHYPPDAGGLACGLKHFPAVRRAPPTSPNTTSPTWRSASLGRLHYAMKLFSHAAQHHLSYYCGSNDVNAGKTQPVLPSALF